MINFHFLYKIMQFRVILNSNLMTRHPFFLRHNMYMFFLNNEFPPPNIKWAPPSGCFWHAPYIYRIYIEIFGSFYLLDNELFSFQWMPLIDLEQNGRIIRRVYNIVFINSGNIFIVGFFPYRLHYNKYVN